MTEGFDSWTSSVSMGPCPHPRYPYLFTPLPSVQIPPQDSPARDVDVGVVFVEVGSRGLSLRVPTRDVVVSPFSSIRSTTLRLALTFLVYDDRDFVYTHR